MEEGGGGLENVLQIARFVRTLGSESDRWKNLFLYHYNVDGLK